jgi:hypothetical protein
MKRFLIYLMTLFLVSKITYTIDQWIVVTTINYPTQAVKKLASIPGWQLIVVADKKTPKDWHLENTIFFKC